MSVLQLTTVVAISADTDLRSTSHRSPLISDGLMAWSHDHLPTAVGWPVRNMEFGCADFWVSKAEAGFGAADDRVLLILLIPAILLCCIEEQSRRLIDKAYHHYCSSLEQLEGLVPSVVQLDRLAARILAPCPFPTIIFST